MIKIRIKSKIKNFVFVSFVFILFFGCGVYPSAEAGGLQFAFSAIDSSQKVSEMNLTLRIKLDNLGYNNLTLILHTLIGSLFCS